MFILLLVKTKDNNMNYFQQVKCLFIFKEVPYVQSKGSQRYFKLPSLDYKIELIDCRRKCKGFVISYMIFLT